jgi:hypothetical protein
MRQVDRAPLLLVGNEPEQEGMFGAAVFAEEVSTTATGNPFPDRTTWRAPNAISCLFEHGYGTVECL